MVFTGDTFFAGDVGRTDLCGSNVWLEQSGKLYDSLKEKVLPLGDYVTFYPAHSAGSICGYEISDREFGTIGYERKTSPLLKVDRDSFAQHLMKRKMYVPPYFATMERYNLEGPPLLSELPAPKPLNPQEFQKEMQKPKTVVVDTREPGAFASSHISSSLSIWLDGLSYFPGWVLKYDQRILLVTERTCDVEEARAYLGRLGFDNVEGYLCPGIRAWRDSGKPIEHLGVLSAATLREKLEGKQLILIDVREDREWEEEHIEGAENIYVGHLEKEASSLPMDKPVAVTCGFGGRGSLAASILKRMGFKTVYNVLGGMRAWKSLGYPVKNQ